MITVETLFPSPIIFNNLGRNFTREELNVVYQYGQNTWQTETGNRISNERRVLQNNSLKDIKNFIEETIKWYIQNIEMPSDVYETYITHSFLNFIDKSCSHHDHSHSNSYLTGILYINADVEKDRIYFNNGIYANKFPYISRSQYNKYNSSEWWFPVETGKLILFPAYINHGVRKVTSDNTRISLVFNTFIRGKIGNRDQFTDLTIM